MSSPTVAPPSAVGPAPAALRILLVDDDRTVREGCAAILQMDGHHVTVLARADEAIDMVRRRAFDLVLADLYMSPLSGVDVLKATLEAHPRTLVVVMTGNPSVSSSLDAVRAGAWDYLPKPFSASHLQVLVGRAAHAIMANGTNAVATPAPGRAREGGRGAKTAGPLGALLGQSPAFMRAIELAEKVATTDASVMISGESGTGKEMIAQFIHAMSRRAQRRLVPVNCAALPDNLLESEMFGHRKGAFTGADRDKAGLLEVANGGTMFLDELTEMALPLQAKLLRVLQDGVVRRLGSETQDATVDVRFISATNRDPAEAVRQGILREDLFYRLRVVPIKLPPLRERRDDIVLLAHHFLEQAWTRHRNSSPCPAFTPAALRRLQDAPWRGNVRELQNFIEHLAVIADHGRAVDAADLPFVDDEVPRDEGDGNRIPDATFEEPFHIAKDQVISRFERAYLAQLVGRSGGNMSKAARQAGIDRTTLYRLMEKHEFSRDLLPGLADR